MFNWWGTVAALLMLWTGMFLEAKKPMNSLVYFLAVFVATTIFFILWNAGH